MNTLYRQAKEMVEDGDYLKAIYAQYKAITKEKGYEKGNLSGFNRAVSLVQAYLKKNWRRLNPGKQWRVDTYVIGSGEPRCDVWRKDGKRFLFNIDERAFCRGTRYYEPVTESLPNYVTDAVVNHCAELRLD